MKTRSKKIIVTMFNSLKHNGLHFTVKHTGKMEGMYSLSTSVALNENCKKHAQIKGSICEKCYANTMTKQYKGLKNCLAKNTEILTTTIIPENLLPVINAHSFRYEAFGDLNNTTQVINYFNICQKNKKVTFALWSKNPWIIKEAIEAGNKKPNNLVIIYSSPMRNIKIELDRMQKVYPFIDKIFTVYDSEEKAIENNAKINCGNKKCIDCLKCYSKRTTKEISELLK